MNQLFLWGIWFSFRLCESRYKSWKRRWFILNDNCLYYFEYTTDKEPRGIIPLENVKVKIYMLALHLNVIPIKQYVRDLNKFVS